eukprot:2774861-Pleurochrysis_carterae.AAC.1
MACSACVGFIGCIPIGCSDCSVCMASIGCMDCMVGIACMGCGRIRCGWMCRLISYLTQAGRSVGSSAIYRGQGHKARKSGKNSEQTAGSHCATPIERGAARSQVQARSAR